MIRRHFAGLAVVVATLAVPLPASASQHLMRIVEIFPGTVAQPTAQYIELQSYNPGQNFTAGFVVAIFDASDTPVTSFTFPGNVPNGARPGQDPDRDARGGGRCSASRRTSP
jgi:hypothetical protein